MKIKKLGENVNQTERPVITIPSPFNKIYFIVDDLGDEELEGFKPEGIQYSDVEFIAPIRAKAKYNDVLSDNGMEWLGLYSNGGDLFIGQVVAGRLYNVEDDILDEVANYIKEPKNESLPEPMKPKVVESTRGQARSNRYNTYKKRIEKAIAKNDTETLARVKEAVMYAPAKELKNSEAEELMTMIKNAKLKESKSIKESFDTNKIDKLWELMRDVDSLEDIYETEDNTIAFVFDSEGNVDKRVEQIMKGLDKEGYMNSFEGTNGSNVIIFDIDFEDELEEGIDYKPKFISDKTIEELQNELNQMYADQYKYGRSIDRPRMWDINYTIKQLKKGLEEDWLDGTLWDSSRVIDLVSYYLTKFDDMPINQLQKKIWITMKEEGSKLPDVETFKKTVIETVDNFYDELDELDEELENIDGWSDTIVDKCEPFFSKAEQVMYGVRNTVRGSYGLGDTVEDLAQVFEELASDAEELAGELRASDKAGELTEDFNIDSLSDKEKYMFLDRMKQDCKYFLGNGNRNIKYLFGNSVKEHIESMKELYNSLKKKPEWLSMEDIEEFEKKMTETL